MNDKEHASVPFWHKIECFSQLQEYVPKKRMPCYYSPLFQSFWYKELSSVTGGCILLTTRVLNLTDDWIALFEDDITRLMVGTDGMAFPAPEGHVHSVELDEKFDWSTIQESLTTLIVVPDKDLAGYDIWKHKLVEKFGNGVRWSSTEQDTWCLRGLEKTSTPPLFVLVFEKELDHIYERLTDQPLRRVLLDRVLLKEEYVENLQATRLWLVMEETLHDHWFGSSWMQTQAHLALFAKWLQIPLLADFIYDLKSPFSTVLHAFLEHCFLRLEYTQCLRFHITNKSCVRVASQLDMDLSSLE
jgi:hypothetical protein